MQFQTAYIMMALTGASAALTIIGDSKSFTTEEDLEICLNRDLSSDLDHFK